MQPVPKPSKFIRQFFKSTNGNMAVFFALFISIIMLAVGAGIDASRVFQAKQSSQNALDASVLASVAFASSQSATEAEITDVGERVFKENFQADESTISNLVVNIDFDATNMKAVGTSEVELQNVFMNIFGIETVKISNTANAVGSLRSKPADISIMLDVSGSMEGSKLLGLKMAVTSFLGKVIGEGNISTSTRVAFAPFSSSVNAGSHANSMVAGTSATNCVGDRVGFDAFTDNPLNLSLFNVDGTHVISKDENNGVYRTTGYAGFSSPAQVNEVNSGTLCPNAEIYPLNGNYNNLVNKLSDYEAVGITAGHLGIAFSWYLISEKWDDQWPAGHAPGSKSLTDKFAILMTDGEFNTYYESANGLPNAQGAALCDNMKADEVTIFAVSFDNESNSEELLMDCVSSPEYFFKADTVEELNEAFSEFANLIEERTARLTK